MSRLISDPEPSDNLVYTWAFLPGQLEPVVAGVLAPAITAAGFTFQYAASYLKRQNAIALGPDLPLSTEVFNPAPGWGMPVSIRDAMPDSWGERVAQHGAGLDAESPLAERELMLVAGSDRIGMLDFQESPHEYVPRGGDASLEELADGALIVQRDDRTDPALRQALRNTMTSPGGAQPKALVTVGSRSFLAKFPVRTDTTPIIKAEAVAISLAHAVGIPVTDHHLVPVRDHGDVLLMQRFDRTAEGFRRQVVSGFTIVQRSWGEGSYPQLVEQLERFGQRDAGRLVFQRIAFNMAVRADDDHLKNISAFWDGSGLQLTPAYDLSPYMGNSQHLNTLTPFSSSGAREFSFAALHAAAHEYRLTAAEARAITEHITDQVSEHLEEAIAQSRLGATEANLVRGAMLRPEIVGSGHKIAVEAPRNRRTSPETGHEPESPAAEAEPVS